jgi:hypothetical protein
MSTSTMEGRPWVSFDDDVVISRTRPDIQHGP